MIDIDQLEERFSIEGEVGFAELENDLVYITVSNRFADAEICLYGAHVMSYRPHSTLDILWLSPLSNFEAGKPIRGGIPVCFPWFGPHKTDPEKPLHGFGRLMNWDVVETKILPTDETMVRLQLCSSAETKAYWPFDFCAEMGIKIGQKLVVSLKVTNTSAQAFEYSCALHSYFYLSAIENITIEGLENTRYYNQLQPGDYVQEDAELKISQAETRHYLNTEEPCIISDSIFRRRIKVEKTGSRVTTVWNPWQETCATIGDMPDNAWETFVCIEAVNAFDDTIKLLPQETHEISALIGLDE